MRQQSCLFYSCICNNCIPVNLERPVIVVHLPRIWSWQSLTASPVLGWSPWAPSCLMWLGVVSVCKCVMYHSGRSGRGDNCIIIIEMVSTSPSSHRTLTRYTDPRRCHPGYNGQQTQSKEISKGKGYLQNIYTIRTLSVTVISSECSPVQRILITKQAISTSPHPRHIDAYNYDSESLLLLYLPFSIYIYSS